MNTQRKYQYSVTEYIQLEKDTDTKHEYHNGFLYALAGGTMNHTRLCSSSHRLIMNGIVEKGKKCEALTSEAKVYISSKNSYVYPDTVVICGAIETATDHKHAIANPTLIIEVLSKSTDKYDRSEKFQLYRKIPSLQEYVLIDQYQYKVELFYRRSDSDLWQISVLEDLDDFIIFQSIDVQISMRDLYARVEIESEN